MDIAKKLKADVTKDGAHKRAFVKIGGKDVLSFGIRHDKTASNGHIPDEMHLNQFKALEFARCNMSLAEYEQVLRAKGII